jgi:tRNA modification GTPase
LHLFFAAPASFTGEDILEIQPHGNPLLLESLLRALLTHPDVRLAEPGEFTRRAFEHGKLDLIQAEALGELLQAESQAALRNAARKLDGALSKPLRALRDSLIDLSLRLELDVDFAEEEADPDAESWRLRLQAARAQTLRLAEGYARGRRLAKVPKVALAGPPNAGKSSLVNALMAEERLLVSDIAGTTRDYIEVPLRLPGGLVHLVDTAGLGNPVDALDEKAQARSREQMAEADLVLRVEKGSKTSGSSDSLTEKIISAYALAEELESRPHLLVRTHADQADFVAVEGWVSVSNADGQGLSELTAEMSRILFSEQGPGVGESPLVTSERQQRALVDAAERLHAADQALANNPAVEIAAFEVAEAVRALRELLGEVAPDEVLNRIFAGFCIGK